MGTITQKEFDELVELHQLWLEDNSKGKRLEFTDCFINGIRCENKNLSYAKFYNSEFNQSEFNNSKFYYSDFNNSDFYSSNFKNLKFYNSKFNNLKFNHSDFSYSTFNQSEFNNSKFANCIGNGKEIVSMQFGTYNVVMLKDIIVIGFEQHTVKKWLSFTDKELESMDGERGLDWWNRYSKIVFDLHKLHFGVEQ